MADLKPCPFCGHVGLDFREGTTYRWRIAECSNCGATTGEERIQTSGEGTSEQWEENCRQRIIAAWNRRAPSSPSIEREVSGEGGEKECVTDEQAEALIEASDGHWKEDVFCIGGPELMALLRAASCVTPCDGGKKE